VPTRPMPNEQIIALLTQTPARIAELTAGLSPAQLQAAPAEGEWSANVVLAHLRSCADVWGGCIAEILAHDTPTLKAMDPRTWTERTNYRELDFAQSLRAFTDQRAALLAVLEPLPPESWQRKAVVKGAGKPLERTVHFYAQWLATHERPHTKQIGRIAAALRE
jgi:hypothetical protein